VGDALPGPQRRTPPPKSKAAQQALADTIGADGATLLEAIYSPAAPPWLREVPAVETLRRIWVQNYRPTPTGLRWRTAAEGIPKAARFVGSPHDGDAHLAAKGTLAWVGYKVALTETCEDDAPNLITHVETVPGPTADGALTPRVHRALRQQGRLPRVHLVDSGFLDAELLVASRRDFEVDLLGPTRKDQRWQARAAEGFGVEHFVVDWARRRVTCPHGRTSIQSVPRLDARGNDSIYVRFAHADCGPCPSRDRCTRSPAKHPRRALALRPQAQYEALRQRRDQESSDAFAREYARRAGIEGTLSQGVRRCGLRRTRYVGLPRTHLGHVATAAALNFVRVAEWLSGTPRARTRGSRFARLMAQA
jgi:Transposase DDE domain